MSHVDEGQLHAWLDGEFPATGGDEAAFEAHLENCALCLGRLERARAEREEADRILGFVAPAGVEIPPYEELAGRGDAAGGERGRSSGTGPGRASRSSRSSRARIALGWAATVVLALGGGWMARGALVAPGSGGGPGGVGGAADAGSAGVALADAEADDAGPGAPSAVAAGGAPTASDSGPPSVGPRFGFSIEPRPAPADAARVPQRAAAALEAAAAPPPPAPEPPAEAARAQEPPPAAPPSASAQTVLGRTTEARETLLAPEAAAPTDAARRRWLWFDGFEVAGADAAPEVAARITPVGVRIENNREERLVYLVLDADYAARARWVPCASADCEGVEPGDATEVSRAGVPGWEESSAVLVFWWHLVPTPEGGLAPDSIRSIPVPYSPVPEPPGNPPG